MVYEEAGSKQVRAQPIVYRVFLASPGDVRDERELARAVVEQVRGERAFRGRIDLQCIGWDQPGGEVAMEANLTPQEAIKRGLPKPSECDLVVVILWSRIGTPLPPEYKKPDGTGYLSGTEWEYREAIGSGTTIWLYRRSQVPQVGFTDPEFEEKRQQWEKVEEFFKGLVGEGGFLRGGVNPYKTPDEFRRQFEQHLRDRLTAVLEESTREVRREPPPQEAEEKHPVQWTKAPYPGLEAFKPEQAPIFFGRGPEIDQLLELLRDPAIRFVAVAGASGSGKSSLVAAGLIPRLRVGALPGSEQWVDIIFRPTERGDDPFLALAYALKEKLGATGQRETELAQDLRKTPALLAACVGEILNGRTQGAELLLVVDQFEEIFTRVNAESRRDFIEIIETASRTARVRVIATIRVDFTANVAEAPALVELFGGRGYFLLSTPGPLALADMIRRPAQLAGLELKDDLCERMLKDTGTGSGALALMAFALHEVYQRSKDSGKLTLEDYETLEGVPGAIKAQAERALLSAGQTDERVLQALFSSLVEFSDQGVATRRRADLGEIRKNLSVARVVDALVDARILVTGGEPEKHPTIEVAHEAVFSAWPRLSTWIDSHASELRTCRRLVRAAQDWKEAGGPRLNHLPDRATLKQYRRVLPVCSLGDDAEVVGRFLSAARNRQRVLAGFLALGVILLSILGMEIWRSRDMNVNVLCIWARAKVGLYDGPEMVEIRGDKFQMGSADCAAVGSDLKRFEGCPQHGVTVADFSIGKYEVTFDEYLAFVMGNRAFRPPHDQGWGRGSRPVINVSWEEAKAYAAWLSKVTRKRFRLPTESEWEYAARGRTTKPYWWGDDAKEGGKVWANCANCGSEWDSKMTAPVGSFPKNDFGLHDMHGNVWEWVEDDWHESYDGAPEDGSARVDRRQRDSYRVIRGGSWRNDARYCRSATRDLDRLDGRIISVGFRLSRSVSLGP